MAGQRRLGCVSSTVAAPGRHRWRRLGKRPGPRSHPARLDQRDRPSDIVLVEAAGLLDRLSDLDQAGDRFAPVSGSPRGTKPRGHSTHRHRRQAGTTAATVHATPRMPPRPRLGPYHSSPNFTLNRQSWARRHTLNPLGASACVITSRKWDGHATTRISASLDLQIQAPLRWTATEPRPP